MPVLPNLETCRDIDRFFAARKNIWRYGLLNYIAWLQPQWLEYTLSFPKIKQEYQEKVLSFFFCSLKLQVKVYCRVWHYRLWSFKARDTKLERFLHKNQHTQSKLLNFENWTNGEPQELAKIRVFKVDYFILPLFLVPKLRSVAQNEWKKHPYILFLLSVQK